MRKLIASAVIAASMLGGISVAIAAPGPDDNPKNDHGQCTAFFNGQKKGNEELTPEQIQDFYNSCKGNISGNPEDNGRYPECFTNSDSNPDNDCSDG